jgi:hypothetical protein
MNTNERIEPQIIADKRRLKFIELEKLFLFQICFICVDLRLISFRAGQEKGHRTEKNAGHLTRAFVQNENLLTMRFLRQSQ